MVSFHSDLWLSILLILFYWIGGNAITFSEAMQKWYTIGIIYKVNTRSSDLIMMEAKSKPNNTVQNWGEFHQNYAPRITHLFKFEFLHISYILPVDRLLNKIIVAVQCPGRVNILLMHFLNFPCVYIKYDNVGELAIFQSTIKMGSTLARFSTPWKKGLCHVYLCISSIWQRAWHSASVQS